MDFREVFAGKLYWPLVQKAKGEFAAHALRELNASQWKSQQELLSIQWQLLRRVVNKAIREVPYYRQVSHSVGWDVGRKEFTYEDFLKLPTVNKEVVRDRLSEFLNPYYQGRITKGSTSGSTGKALILHYCSEHESYSEAARWRAKGWWGIYPGTPHVAFWGRFYNGTKDRLTQIIKSYCMNTFLISAFDIRKKTITKIWPRVCRFKPRIIYGYPSAIFALAEYLSRKHISTNNLDIQVVMITAESSSMAQRALIEEVFRCKTANEYGCSETGGFVYECPHGNWHISSDVTFIEFLDQNGKPVLPGEKGEIVLTHLRNSYMPLIRYRVGDIGSPRYGTCPCGRGLPLMNIELAKESDRIWLKDGEFYMSGDFLYIHKVVMEKYPNSILQFRVIQRELDLFDMEVVPGSGSVDKGEEHFKRLIKKQLGEKLKIRLKRVAEIERDPSGKLRYFISALNKSHSS